MPIAKQKLFDAALITLPLLPVMSFGIGVGDILAISKLARGVFKQLQDASEQSKALGDE